MSATILNPLKLAHDLGISEKDFKYIKIEPQFKPESNKIFNLGIANFQWNQAETAEDRELFWNEVIERIDLILETHKDQKGIIHANKHDICKLIKEKSKYSDRIIIHSDSLDPDDLTYKQRKIDEHCDINNKEPTVLCSPSMTEGVDLYSERSRFQIFIKIPYPDISNKWISARMDADRRYFKQKTAIAICQGIGRSVRNANDWCITYTLDSRFDGFMKWDCRFNEMFNRHQRPVSELKEFWKEHKLNRLLKNIPRKEKRTNKTRRSMKNF